MAAILIAHLRPDRGAMTLTADRTSVCASPSVLEFAALSTQEAKEAVKAFEVDAPARRGVGTDLYILHAMCFLPGGSCLPAIERRLVGLVVEPTQSGNQRGTPSAPSFAIGNEGETVLVAATATAMHHCIMQEVLSKTADPKAPLRREEFYELSLLDEANELGTRYCVRQAHAEWSEIDGQIMFDREEVDHFWILDEAKRRYAERRLALTEMGFIYSDMDF